ncbi:MAG: hypothetical protein EXR70_12415 [Deltaproteobacteria bacterium]|nr:hypothetical protein [Deltaproteobacteria bacterium]
MNKVQVAERDSEGLLDLLEGIVATYRDSDSRPVESLVLYRQCLQLGKNYRVHLAKRFLVVEGGVQDKRDKTQARAQTHLTLATKLELGEDR